MKIISLSKDYSIYSQYGMDLLQELKNAFMVSVNQEKKDKDFTQPLFIFGKIRIPLGIKETKQ
ncbi:MAG: hypothetical protein C0415_06475 [Thermodesulfovibrio sp.]|nr:hypothetical protein [Thermodesulfovibrio sp.]